MVNIWAKRAGIAIHTTHKMMMVKYMDVKSSCYRDIISCYIKTGEHSGVKLG